MSKIETFMIKNPIKQDNYSEEDESYQKYLYDRILSGEIYDVEALEKIQECNPKKQV